VELRRINRIISPNDEMVPPLNPEAYFEVGAAALQAIEASLTAAAKDRVSSILDFACGHGRVLRYLQAAFPDASLTACDINRDAVDFCASTFGARGVYSSDELSEVELIGAFDLIWVGSLLTHLDQDRWRQFLLFLADHLAEGGLFVFSTHGPWIAEQARSGQRFRMDRALQDEMIAQFDASGFGFSPYSQAGDYGLSLCSPDWVLATLKATVPSLHLVSYVERGWRSSHDIVACQRPSTDTASH
jgi:SAM-dependent methyltransferase